MLTLLAFDDRHGRFVSGMLEAPQFDPPYDEIARVVLDHRRRFGTAPGRAHLDDIFDSLLEGKDGPRTEVLHRLLAGMIDQSTGLNGEYVASRVSQFIRHQTLKAGIIAASERYQHGGDGVIEDVETIMQGTLAKRAQAQDPGTFLNDPKRALNFLNNPAQIFRLGIPELDRFDICPTRKEMFLFIAPRKRGKTWFAIDTGRKASVQRAKVLHITLEMSEDKISQRYMQTFFAVAKRDEKFAKTLFEMDDHGELTGLRQVWESPRFSFDHPDINAFLRRNMTQGGVTMGNICVKSFPSGTLTHAQYESHLDYLDTAHRFVPDVVLFDYPDLMAVDIKNLRTSLGQIFVRIRGTAQERNHAVVALTQGNRESGDAKVLNDKHVAEDISKIATADTVITMSRTEAERKLGLARLFVSNARGDADGFQVLISQSYTTGQFCTASAPINSKYESVLDRAGGKDAPNDDDDEE